MEEGGSKNTAQILTGNTPISAIPCIKTNAKKTFSHYFIGGSFHTIFLQQKKN
jgi:hypothetical protein